MHQINRLDIPGSRDAAVRDYCTWQKSQVDLPDLKMDYEKAYEAIIERGLDLELIHQDQDPDFLDFLIKKGVRKGSALRVIGDIVHWVNKKRKRSEAEEELR
jgi:hypothetical protein